MSLTELRARGRLQPHKTSRREVDDLLRLAARNLMDASVQGVSADGRFRFAYEAAIALATVPLYCSGFRTAGAGHHHTTLTALPLIMGTHVAELADYFDTCRTKRNISAYDYGGAISEPEVAELLREVATFQERVLEWLRTQHPELRP